MKKYLWLLGALFLFQTSWSQFKKGETFTNKDGSDYKFTVIRHLEDTSVKNQNRTGTCWSFSSMSFFESELLRKGKGVFDLSEMWVARNAYLGKAMNYLRMGGHANFGPGGEFHDIPWVAKRYGLVPESAYSGRAYGGDAHNHAELQAVLKGMVDALNKKPQNKRLTKVWKKAYMNVVDAYLGDVPEDTENFKFNYKGKQYTPKTFADFLDIDMDDYVELTSFTHHPYYTRFALEIPDNWQMATAYNIPLDEFMSVAENAIMKGYTFAWGADVSEKGFSHRNALAIMPVDEKSVQDRKSKDKFFKENGKKIPNGYLQPVKEKWVTPEEKQEAYEDGRTTDDHGMHIVGIVKDQTGKKYFVVKNSWGTKFNKLNGYFLSSFSFFRYKSIAIMMHKDVLSKSLRKKLKID